MRSRLFDVIQPELRIYYELASIFTEVRHRVKFAGREVDIFLPKEKIGIKYDGSYWHKNKEAKDRLKNSVLSDHLTLIRLRETPLSPLGRFDLSVDQRGIELDDIKALLRQIMLASKQIDKEVRARIDEYQNSDSWINDVNFTRRLADRNQVDYKNSLAYLYPSIAAQWNPDKNGNLTPEQFTPGSQTKIWWLEPSGNEYQASIYYRVRKHQKNILRIKGSSLRLSRN
jgi:hypothetical protein